MDEATIIVKAREELTFAQGKLATIGYPGLTEVEGAVGRALALLKTPPDAEDPTDPAALEAEKEQAEADEDAEIEQNGEEGA